MPITIKKENSRPEVRFGNLAYGDTFIYKNEVHMKIKIFGCGPEDERDTAIRLDTGKENFFNYDDPVVPTKEATLTYSMV